MYYCTLTYWTALLYLLLIYSDDAEALLGSTNTLNTTGGTENYYYQEYTTLRNQWIPWCSLLVYIDRLVKIKPNLYEINKIIVLDFIHWKWGFLSFWRFSWYLLVWSPNSKKNNLPELHDKLSSVNWCPTIRRNRYIPTPKQSSNSTETFVSCVICA